MRKRKPKLTPELTADHESRKAIWEHYSNFGAPRIKELAIRVLARLPQASVREKP